MATIIEFPKTKCRPSGLGTAMRANQGVSSALKSASIHIFTGIRVERVEGQRHSGRSSSTRYTPPGRGMKRTT